jgi:hypothetical protein
MTTRIVVARRKARSPARQQPEGDADRDQDGIEADFQSGTLRHDPILGFSGDGAEYRHGRDRLGELPDGGKLKEGSGTAMAFGCDIDKRRLQLHRETVPHGVLLVSF